MQNRAYAVLTLKAVSDAGDARTFSGWATTPEVDRVGDTIDPLGASFKNPVVLLHQHDNTLPIGSVTLGAPTAKGIEFTATIPTIADAGPLKDRVDTAWGEIKHGLVRAVSIGFRPIKYAFRDDYSVEYQEIEIFELSVVSIPANAGAIISEIKSLDAKYRREHGVPEPESPPRPAGAATGKSVRVVRLETPARDRAEPFIIRSIKRIAQ